MAVIEETLTPRKFELIRDQIATILAAELPNQATLNADKEIDAKVWLERLVPLSQQECPAVNVFAADGKFERFTTETQTGEYMFAIDVFTRGATEGSTAEQRGDLISTKKMMRLVGIIQAIFSHWKYCKLGFANNFIDRVEIQSFKLMEPVKAHDNHNVAKGRLILMVKAEETVAPVEPVLIDGYDTQVLLHDTQYGYVFSGDQVPPLPPQPGPGGWIRNPDWLPLPVVGPGDSRFVALYLVFENEPNTIKIQSTNNAITIDWGDGTSVNAGITNQKSYDYGSLPGVVNQYYDGRNYKQVLIDITENPGFTNTALYVDRNLDSGVNLNGSNNIVDCCFSWGSVVTFVPSQQRKMLICEQFKVFDLAMVSSNNYFNKMYSLRSLQFPFGQFTTFANPSFQGVEVFENIDLSVAANSAISFSGGKVKRVKNVDVSVSTSNTRMFETCIDLEYIESVDFGGSVTTCQQMFNNCQKLREINFLNCSGVNNTFLMFNNCVSLANITMQGLTVGVDLSNKNMATDSIDNFFTSLGIASGSQTITVSGNPGASTCDVTIATLKGFTVVI